MNDKEFGETIRREDDLWEWHVLNKRNGDIVATSGMQGFTERNDAREALEREFPGIEVRDADRVHGE